MAITQFDVITRAMVKIGAQPVQSFEEDTDEAGVAQILYQGIKDRMISSYPWRFAEVDVVLSKLVAAPTDPTYTAQYQLPSDFLEALEILRVAGSPIDWARQGNRILSTTTTGILLRYRVKTVNESAMPAWFVDALVARCAQEFCEPVQAEGAVAERAGTEAQTKMTMAMRINAIQTKPKKIMQNSNSAWAQAFRGGYRR